MGKLFIVILLLIVAGLITPYIYKLIKYYISKIIPKYKKILEDEEK